MFILILVITSVMLNSGAIIPVDPPRTAVIESYPSLKACEDDRMAMNALMALSNRDGEDKTYHLECKPAKRTQL